MSHFTRIQTRLVAREHLLGALRDLGFAPQVGRLEIRGFMGVTRVAEIRIASGTPGYDIGFAQVGDTFELVADFWGIQDLRQEEFVQRLTQAYARRAVRAQLAEQGFSVAEEVRTAEGGVRLVLRRVV